MQIVVAASDEQWKELTCSRTQIDWKRVEDARAFMDHRNADAFFSLQESGIFPGSAVLKKPVFINSVINSLADLEAPAHILRINGWVTFLKRPVWEIAGQVDQTVESVFDSLGIKLNAVRDEPGFVAARIIAMIINEAYFTVEDKVSSKAEIDIAMKLGTNYPYGPFEWAGLIGINNILSLLQKLNITDTRYKPAGLLIHEVKLTKS